MLYAEAIVLAETAIDAIKDYCDFIKLTGDLRRAAEEVADIKVVCVPTRVPAVNNPRVDEVGEVVAPEFVAAVKTIGRVESGDPFSSLMQIIIQEKIRLFLFMPPSPDRYRMVSITTGPGEFVSSTLQPAWSGLGWVTTAKGLRKQEECKYRGYQWRTKVTDPELPPDWANEPALFTWLGLEYVEPEDR